MRELVGRGGEGRVSQDRLELGRQRVVLRLVEDDLEALPAAGGSFAACRTWTTSGKPSRRSDEGLLNSAASSRPRSIAGTISPPGRMVTAAPISLNRSAERPTVRYFMPLKSSPALDLLLEPAERLGRHREVQEADDVELEDVVESSCRAPRRRRSRTRPSSCGRPSRTRAGCRTAKGLVLAVTIDAARRGRRRARRMHRIQQLEGRHHGAGGQHVDLEAAARHVVDLLGVVERVFVEDVLGRPGALASQGHGLRA